MVARNSNLQDLPYARLLQVSEEDREFLTLDDLKPHQLTELTGLSTHNPTHNNNVSSPPVQGQELHCDNNNAIGCVDKVKTGLGFFPECMVTNSKEGVPHFVSPSQQHPDGSVVVLGGTSGGGGGVVDPGNGMLAFGPNPANQIYYDLNTQQTTK